MSAIEWTDATWNPVTGCDRVSPGCAHCYALDLAARLKGMGQPKYQRDGDPKTSGPGFGLTLHPDVLEEPLRWRRPRMVFVNSMSDLFHEEIPYEFVRDVFNVMRRCDGGVIAATGKRAPAHTFQVLTKRPERALEFWRERKLGFDGWPPNVWLGVSIENARYTWRADVLREIPAAVRFISAEPLLGSLFPKKRGRDYETTPLRFEGDRGYREVPPRGNLDLTGIDWLIVGGESGPEHRPLNLDHARELRDACLVRSIDYDDGSPRTAFFFKQVGGRTPKSGGRLLDGREWNELPPREAAAEGRL